MRIMTITHRLLIGIIVALTLHTMEVRAQAPIDLLEPVGSTSVITLGTNPLDVLNQYLQPFMPYVIGMSAGLAVFMIIIGGFQIMLGGGNIASSPGKDRILAALAGLLLLVFSATILYMLNANYFVLRP